MSFSVGILLASEAEITFGEVIKKGPAVVTLKGWGPEVCQKKNILKLSRALFVMTVLQGKRLQVQRVTTVSKGHGS